VVMAYTSMPTTSDSCFPQHLIHQRRGTGDEQQQGGDQQRRGGDVGGRDGRRLAGDT
jgi:hypothetical protein